MIDIIISNDIDTRIKAVLKTKWYKEKKKLTTYEIAKRCGICWDTALTHLYKLDIKHEDIIEKNTRKTLWWL